MITLEKVATISLILAQQRRDQALHTLRESQRKLAACECEYIKSLKNAQKAAEKGFLFCSKGCTL